MKGQWIPRSSKMGTSLYPPRVPRSSKMGTSLYPPRIDFDVAVVGAGVVGATLTAILGRQGFRVAILDQREASLFSLKGEYDTRVLAITPASEQVFRAVGAWHHIKAGRVGYFREMQVWDANGYGSIHFDSADICAPTLGYIVEHRLLQSALEAVLDELVSVTWYRPAVLDNIDCQDEGVQLELQDGRRLVTKLLVGADGSDSRVRKLAGIGIQTHPYQQTALTCTIKTEKPHGETARQRFLDTGPLAFLPLDDPYHCSIVWSTTPAQARSLSALSEEAFRLRLEQAFDSALGKILAAGPRRTFPLMRSHAERYVQPRLALLGDAAHRIHPLAGQGANLGILDAATLAEVLSAAAARGEDLGALQVLRRYERWRKGENLAMMMIMDLFKELFASQLALLRWARNLGLDLTDWATPIKRWIMRRAMGLTGDLPRLATTGRPQPLSEMRSHAGRGEASTHR